MYYVKKLHTTYIVGIDRKFVPSVSRKKMRRRVEVGNACVEIPDSLCWRDGRD
jgi:hypothetical protein